MENCNGKKTRITLNANTKVSEQAELQRLLLLGSPGNWIDSEKCNIIERDRLYLYIELVRPHLEYCVQETTRQT